MFICIYVIIKSGAKNKKDRHKNGIFCVFCKRRFNMNSNNIVLVALMFLLVNNNTISTTQLLLLLALLSTTTGHNCLFGNNSVNA